MTWREKTLLLGFAGIAWTVLAACLPSPLHLFRLWRDRRQPSASVTPMFRQHVHVALTDRPTTRDAS